MVLYCVPKLRLMGQKFSVRERIDIAGMEVQTRVPVFSVLADLLFCWRVCRLHLFWSLTPGAGKCQAEPPSHVRYHRQTALAGAASQVGPFESDRSKHSIPRGGM